MWTTHVRRTDAPDVPLGNADHRDRTRREESVRALSSFALSRHAPQRAGRRTHSPCGCRPRRAGGVASPRPLSRVTRDSPKSASQVSRSDGGDEYAISAAANPAAEQSAHRRSANPQPPSAPSGRTGEADFPRGEREQDAIPPARRSVCNTERAYDRFGTINFATKTWTT